MENTFRALSILCYGGMLDVLLWRQGKRNAIIPMTLATAGIAFQIYKSVN